MTRPRIHPVMTCAAAREFELAYFAGDDDGSRVSDAMLKAGEGVGMEILALIGETGRRRPKVVILAGKGRNACDALIAVRALTGEIGPVFIFIPIPRKELSVDTRKALAELIETLDEVVSVVQWVPGETEFPSGDCVVIDGLTGSGFKPPLTPVMRGMIEAANASGEAMRVAVDLPSGAGDDCDEVVFNAHLTVATGIFKAPLLDSRVRRFAGRIRYADTGFFKDKMPTPALGVYAPKTLRRADPLRPAFCDKRDFGHVAFVGGHRTMPGALLMNVLGALRAGAGLVTAFCPESVHGAFAAAAPEAMWTPLPEAPDGSHRASSIDAVLSRTVRADIIVCGSGAGTSPEFRELVSAVLMQSKLPVVLDGDALRPEVIEALAHRPAEAGPVIVTPHEGEFIRISGGPSGDGFEAVHAFAAKHKVIVLLKGATSRVSDGRHGILIPCGGPALARGGSGDLLAGILGALLARAPLPDIETVSRAAAWHGAAADVIAEHRGATCLHTTEILDGLAAVLRGEKPVRYR